MALRLIYRAYGGDNEKVRPPWFDKLLAAASFARAAQVAGAVPLWLNDGPVPPPWVGLQRRYGTVAAIPGGPIGLRGSYVRALRLAIESDWPDTDVVYFCEDDYLHTPDALQVLGRAVQEMPDVSYFALYASAPGFAGELEWPDDYRYPPGWRLAPPRTAAGHEWVNVASTASTFAARVGALRRDYWMFRLCMFPYRRMFLDHETCLLYQGHRPYRGRQLLTGLSPVAPGVRGTVKAAALAPSRVCLNVAARKNAAAPHHLYAAVPNLGCHIENGVMTPGRDWEALAHDTARWAQAEGLMPLPAWAASPEPGSSRVHGAGLTPMPVRVTMGPSPATVPNDVSVARSS